MREVEGVMSNSRKLMLLATLAMLAAGSANASTLTGNYTASISSNANATLTDNLANTNFSLTLGAARSNFITVNPGNILGCWPGCYPDTGTVTVTFSNLKVNGVALPGGGTFTETGLYTANYATQTDSVVWNGATAQSGFGLDQDGNVPLVFSFLIPDGPNGTLKLNLVDGADWNVQTYVEAQLVATPLPATAWLFGAGLGGLGLLMRRKKKVAAEAAA